MSVTKRHVQVAAGILGGIALLIVVTSALRNRPGEQPPALPAPKVPPSTSREQGAKADEILAKLQLGMLRVDVEAILGPPAAVDTVQSANGRISYRATFMRDRIRPPLPPLVLEFDAAQPGHPLLMAKPM